MSHSIGLTFWVQGCGKAFLGDSLPSPRPCDELSQKRRITVDQFIESRISSRKRPLERRIDEMLGTLVQRQSKFLLNDNRAGDGS